MPEKLVLLLNDITHEGLLSALITAGRKYKQKQLHSREENWHSILALFREYEVVAVIGKILAPTYRYLTDPDYAVIRNELFKRAAAVPNLFFVYEDLLISEPDLTDEPEPEHIRAMLREGNEFLSAVGIDLLPYKKRAEVTIAAQSFLEEIEEGLLFRLYVPSGRLWDGEIGRLLTLFKDYLVRVVGIAVRLDQISTSKGVIYAFHGQSVTNRRELTTHFEEFSQFADLCVKDPKSAEELLTRANVKPAEVSQIVARYSKEVRRLQVDLKHAREEKLLSIRHRMESELVDFAEHISPDALARLVDATVPNVVSLSDDSKLLLPYSSQVTASSVTVNVNPQFIHTVRGVVAQEIAGNVNFSEEDRQLIELFEHHAGNEATQLTSALHELNDESAPEAGRVTAKQRIKKFLIGVGKKTGDVAATLLEKYIEKKVMGL